MSGQVASKPPAEEKGHQHDQRQLDESRVSPPHRLCECGLKFRMFVLRDERRHHQRANHAPDANVEDRLREEERWNRHQQAGMRAKAVDEGDGDAAREPAVDGRQDEQRRPGQQADDRAAKHQPSVPASEPDQTSEPIERPAFDQREIFPDAGLGCRVHECVRRGRCFLRLVAGRSFLSHVEGLLQRVERTLHRLPR